MLDHANLHRHDFKLLADFLANGVFAAAAGARQLMLRKLVENLDAWQFGGQGLAFTATPGWSDDLFFSFVDNRFSDAFRFVEQGQLRRGRIDYLLGLASEQALAQQCILL